MPRLRLVGNLNTVTIAAFTLIEVMTVIALIAILITLALPGMGNLSSSADSLNYANTLANTLNEAKEKAIQLKRYVTICATSAVTVTQTSDIAIPACVNNTTTWNSFVSYIDSALNPGTTTQLLFLSGNMKTNSIKASSVGSIVFNYLGLVQVNGTSQGINFFIAAPGCSGNNGRQVSLNVDGIVTISNTGC